MVNDKKDSDMIQEFYEHITKVDKKRTTFNADFKVSSLTKKLLSSWYNFTRSLKHKKINLTLINAINSIGIDKNYRASHYRKEEINKVNFIENSNNN